MFTVSDGGYHGCATDPLGSRKNVGQKPLLKSREIWGVRVKLQVEKRTRDLAPFNLAIDSTLRGCDLVSLKVSDIASGGDVRPRAMMLQHKTRRPVHLKLPSKQECRSRSASPNHVSRQAIGFSRAAVTVATNNKGKLVRNVRK